MADHSRTKTRKDRIMDAALRIFAEKGFQNATITEISKEAGVSEATIYEYFGTKEDLLFAIPEKISNETYEESQTVLPFIKGCRRKDAGHIAMLCSALSEQSPLFRAWFCFNSCPTNDSARHPHMRRFAVQRMVFLDCIREGIADGTFKKDANPYLIRSMLMGTIEHLFIHWHMQGMPKEENKHHGHA